MQLSYNQQQMLIVQHADPTSPAYNGPIFKHIDNASASLDNVQHAIDAVVDRHEVLHTTFVANADGAVLQRVVHDWRPTLHIHDAPDIAHARRLVADDMGTAFDLTSGPPVRAMLIAAPDTATALLVMNMHHAVFDAVTFDILDSDLDVAIIAHDDLEPPPRIQYLDYAVHQRQLLDEDGALEPLVDHWRTALAGVPEALELVTDRPRPAVQSFRGGSVGVRVDGEAWTALARLGRDVGCTDFGVVASCWAVVLCRYGRCGGVVDVFEDGPVVCGGCGVGVLDDEHLLLVV
jgi:hypothetical protein